MNVIILQHFQKLRVNTPQILENVLQLTGVLQQLIFMQRRPLINQIVILLDIKMIVLTLDIVNQLHDKRHVAVAEADDSIQKNRTVRFAFKAHAKLISEGTPQLCLLVFFFKLFKITQLGFELESLDNAAHLRNVDLVIAFGDGGFLVGAPEDVGRLHVVELVQFFVQFYAPDQGAPEAFGLLDDYDG